MGVKAGKSGAEPAPALPFPGPSSALFPPSYFIFPLTSEPRGEIQAEAAVMPIAVVAADLAAQLQEERRVELG